MKTAIYTSLFLMAANAALYAATVTANNSGNWTDTATWQGGTIPAADSTVYINKGVDVTLDSAATITNFGYINSGDNNLQKLILTGADASLTVTGNSNLYYNNRFNLTVENGASFVSTGSIGWGSGGYNNMTVSGAGSYFEAKFGEMRGSAVEGGSILKITDSATAQATGEWKLNANSNGKMTLEVSNGATLNTQALYLDASANSTSLVKVLSGGKILSASGSMVGINYWNAVQAGSTNRVVVAGTGSTIQTQGNGSVMVGNSSSAVGSAVTSTLQLGYVDEGGTFTAASGNAVNGNYEFRVYASGQVNILLGASNAVVYGETVTYADTLINARYFKEFVGDLNIDLTNVVGLEEGTYSFALFACNSGQTLDFANWESKIEQGIIESDTVKLYYEDGKCYNVSGNILYLNVNVVPEPATYAAIFGALALAFAAYRRRK